MIKSIYKKKVPFPRATIALRGYHVDMDNKDKELLKKCVVIAHEAMEKGNHPFGALLADKDGKVLLTQGNEFTLGGSAYHAETILVMKAARLYDPDFLSTCTLYTNFEPCCMCTGAVYWSNIGRICFGMTEAELLRCTGDNEENPTFDLSSREVVSHGQKKIVIDGPTDDEELKALILKDHMDFWKNRG